MQRVPLRFQYVTLKWH